MSPPDPLRLGAVSGQQGCGKSFCIRRQKSIPCKYSWLFIESAIKFCLPLPSFLAGRPWALVPRVWQCSGFSMKPICMCSQKAGLSQMDSAVLQALGLQLASSLPGMPCILARKPSPSPHPAHQPILRSQPPRAPKEAACPAQLTTPLQTSLRCQTHQIFSELPESPEPCSVHLGWGWAAPWDRVHCVSLPSLCDFSCSRPLQENTCLSPTGWPCRRLEDLGGPGHQRPGFKVWLRHSASWPRFSPTSTKQPPRRPSWHDSETGAGSHSGGCRCCNSHLMPSTAPWGALGAKPRLLAGPGHVLSDQRRADCQDGRERQTVPTLREQRPGEGRLLRQGRQGWGLCCTEEGAGSCRATDRLRTGCRPEQWDACHGEERRLL